jgi:methionyl-tRNA formyltransferase
MNPSKDQEVIMDRTTARMVFIGAVEEGWQILKAILEVPEHRRDLCGIVTLTESKHEGVSGVRSFDDLADYYEIPLYKIEHINELDSITFLSNLDPDLLLVFGWSQLLSGDVLKIPRLGTLGLHSSLLPKHRGRSPIPWAIIKGLKETGNTLFYLDEGVDSGDIIGQISFEITLDDNATTLYDKSVQSGVDLVLGYLHDIKLEKAPRIPQDHSKADYWPKRGTKDSLIHWELSTIDIYNLIRGATHPYPGAFTFDRNEKLTVWAAKLPSGDEHLEDFKPSKPGTIISVKSNGIEVATGDGYLSITQVQPMDGTEIDAATYAATRGLTPCMNPFY